MNLDGLHSARHFLAELMGFAHRRPKHRQACAVQENTSPFAVIICASSACYASSHHMGSQAQSEGPLGSSATVTWCYTFNVVTRSNNDTRLSGYVVGNTRT